MRASLSRTSILGAGPKRAFSARDLNLGGTVSLPLWRPPSPGNGSAIARLLGSMSATFGGTLRQTDAGQGKGLSTGLIWMPTTKLRLIGNWSTSIDSVPDAQRFAPAYYGAPITVFDFATGESAQVLPILGGTPDLLPPRFDRIALSASAATIECRQWHRLPAGSHARTGGGIPRAVHARCRRTAHHHRPAPDQFPLHACREPGLEPQHHPPARRGKAGHAADRDQPQSAIAQSHHDPCGPAGNGPAGW